LVRLQIEPGFLHWAGRNHSSWWQWCPIWKSDQLHVFCSKHARLYKTAVIILECAWYGAQFGRTRLPNWMAPTSHLGLQATICSKLAAVPNLVRTELWRPATVLHYYRFIGRIWPALFRTNRSTSVGGGTWPTHITLLLGCCRQPRQHFVWFLGWWYLAHPTTSVSLLGLGIRPTQQRLIVLSG